MHAFVITKRSKRYYNNSHLSVLLTSSRMLKTLITLALVIFNVFGCDETTPKPGKAAKPYAAADVPMRMHIFSATGWPYFYQKRAGQLFFRYGGRGFRGLRRFDVPISEDL
ncbi:hypothetical protein QR680_015910 [Steinernema hermaphroditum]|uniref:Uncharacterized protein n=1 Tax=Steinernema hermaphroditum TaxID=289476 RepID=A0AA39LLE7_9BILA|nr:hypothetical protein QR680_015910 [Steinernema hermaphroditum]